MYAADEILEEEPPTQRQSPSGIFLRPATSIVGEWERLDDQLRGALVERAIQRAAKDREESLLDGVATGLARVRGALDVLASRAADAKVMPFLRNEPTLAVALSSAYRFCIEIASELVAIESMSLAGEGERAETAAFLPFALGSFDELVTARFDALHEVIDGVECDELNALLWDMGSVRIALARIVSSLLAAA